MGYVNFQKSALSQRTVMTLASGRHRGDGTAFLGYTLGTDPVHTNYIRLVLGEGEWNRCLSVYWEGFNVPPERHQFFKGGENADASVWFERDSAHQGTVMLDFQGETGLGTVIKSGGETELPVGFFECELFPDFDENGNQIDENENLVTIPSQELDKTAFFYTANPANVLVGWLLKYAETYDRYSFDWQKMVAWRDYCNGLETVDYRVIPNLEGFGLTVNFYNDTTFTALVEDAARIDPYINFESSSGAPANGINAESFSARYEGFIKQKFTEEFTFLVARSDTAKVWIDDVLIIDEGEFTGTANLTADQFHSIKVDWVNSSGSSELILSWSSTNTPIQVIKTEHYYPRVEQRPRYEGHIAIISTASPAFLIPLIGRITNSIHQTVEGKEFLECIEQKQHSFAITEADFLRDGNGESKAKWERARNDVQANEAYDIYEAWFNDLDDRYLAPISTPVRYYADPDNVPENPKVKRIEFSLNDVFSVNMTRWQAFKILKYLMALEVNKDFKLTNDDFHSRTYSIQAGDLGTVTFDAAGLDTKTFLCIDSTDHSPEETANKRGFVLQEFHPPSETQTLMELGG
jgi:PA14 domain